MAAPKYIPPRRMVVINRVCFVFLAIGYVAGIALNTSAGRLIFLIDLEATCLLVAINMVMAYAATKNKVFIKTLVWLLLIALVIFGLFEWVPNHPQIADLAPGLMVIGSGLYLVSVLGSKLLKRRQ